MLAAPAGSANALLREPAQNPVAVSVRIYMSLALSELLTYGHHRL
jgi:hypothetical protein